MCMEDVRIGRKARASATRLVDFSGTAVKVLEQDEYRTAVLLGPDNSNGCYLVWKRQPTAASGHFFNAQSGLCALDIQHHGSLVTDELWVISSVTGTISVTEVFLAEK